MGAFRLIRMLARIIYHLSGAALVAAVVALFVSGPDLALILGICAVGGWIVAQVLAKVAIWLFIRSGGDLMELELGTWR